MHAIRYSLRSLRRSPGFTAIAIAMLAVGLGSNVAVFSLIDSLFLRALPVWKPSELARISSIDRQGRAAPLPSKVLETLRGEPMLRGVCGYAVQAFTTKIAGTTGDTLSLTWSGDCFGTLGVPAQIGRPFTPDEDRRGGKRVALLTDSLWRSAFNASPSAVGAELEVEGQPVRIIGVAAPAFTGLQAGSRLGLILPLEQTPLDFIPNPNRPVYFRVDILARRAAGAALTKLQARLAVIGRQLLEQSVPLRYNPAQRRDYLARRIVAQPADAGADGHLKERFGDPLWTLLGICAAVLLIACVNLATLLLARGVRRQRELAVRLALGAGRARVAWLMALDGIWLVSLGALGGVVLARWIVRLAAVQAADLFAVDANPLPDARSVAFLGGAVLAVCAILAAPAVWQSRRFAVPGMRGTVGAGTGGHKALLGVQVALTLALVSAGSLFTTR